MKRLLLDTNIYGLLTADSDLHKFHDIFEQRKEEIIIYGFNVIRKELKRVPKIVIEGVNVRASLLRTYSFFIIKEYDLEDKLKMVADDYYGAYVLFLGNLLKDDIYNDFLIVACASMKDIDIVVSEDNATLTSELFRKAYDCVNTKAGIRVPSFIGSVII